MKTKDRDVQVIVSGGVWMLTPQHIPVAVFVAEKTMNVLSWDSDDIRAKRRIVDAISPYIYGTLNFVSGPSGMCTCGEPHVQIPSGRIVHCFDGSPCHIMERL